LGKTYLVWIDEPTAAGAANFFNAIWEAKEGWLAATITHKLAMLFDQIQLKLTWDVVQLESN
jgi:hypothetical protein